MNTLKALFKAMRPRQWIKNLVIFAALVFDRQLTPSHFPEILRTFTGFIIFCLLSGVVYVLNDVADADADRNHPEKRHRPIASGQLPVKFARLVSLILIITIIPLSYLLSPRFGLVATGYLLLNLAYSNWIKHIPLLDVLSIALGFVLRVAAGVVLIIVTRFSPWLYVVTTLGSLYIGFGKRRAELALLADGANSHRKVLDGYTIPLLDQFITIVSGTTIIAYSLYTFSAPNLPANHIMMLTIPFVLYGIFRYLYLIQVKHGGGAPEEVLLSDRPLQISIVLWGISILLIFYIFPPAGF
ncbi:MAG TPA: decaprenyl-phosphate phosphoribosyltransferase [Anaerolineales bacterium]|nr:decaprenyl-phosphate phosphoribosyltransferase [Anaerolineales bacterium]